MLVGCPPHSGSPLLDMLQLVTNLKNAPRKEPFGSVINEIGAHCDNTPHGWGRSHRGCGKTWLSGQEDHRRDQSDIGGVIRLDDAPHRSDSATMPFRKPGPARP
jgi:hypothetical protein